MDIHETAKQIKFLLLCGYALFIDGVDTARVRATKQGKLVVTDMCGYPTVFRGEDIDETSFLIVSPAGQTMNLNEALTSAAFFADTEEEMEVAYETY